MHFIRRKKKAADNRRLQDGQRPRKRILWFGEKIASIATGKEYAIKWIIKKPTENPEPVDELMNEFNIMRKISHKNIIKLEGFFEDDTFIFFVLELAEKENLYDRLKKVKNFEHQEPEAAKYMFQVLQAVNYLHSQEPPIIQEASSPKISFKSIKSSNSKTLAFLTWTTKRSEKLFAARICT